MIDDIFWLMGFETKTLADKVIVYIICIMYIFCIIFLTGSYRARSCGSRAQNKPAAIAQSVDDMSDRFRPSMREGWLSYIKQAYPDGAAAGAAGPALGLLARTLLLCRIDAQSVAGTASGSNLPLLCNERILTQLEIDVSSFEKVQIMV